MVKAGDLIAQLDSSNQQLALAQAQQALNELTSPSAIATAQQAVVTAQTNLINAQYVLNGATTAGTNQSAINNAYAALALAQNNLNAAQNKYDPVSGQPLTNPSAAKLYQSLYNAQQAYNTALANYNAIAAKSNPLTVGSAQANVALDQAQITEAQNLLTALTGGTVPANATGTGLNALNQAKLNLQTAQNNLAYTNLYSPISGTVLTVSNSVGDTINSGNTFVTIADLSQSELTIYMDPLDYSNIKVGYNNQCRLRCPAQPDLYRQSDPDLPAAGHHLGQLGRGRRRRAGYKAGRRCSRPDPASGRDRFGGYHCGPGE